MRHIQLYSLVDRRQRRKTALARSIRRRLARFGLGYGAFGLLLLVAGLLSLSLAYTSLIDGLPSPDLLPGMLHSEDGPLMQPTRIYDRTGQHLLMSLENPGITRRALPIDPNQPEHLSPELVRVTVGLLDPTYWQGPGFSIQHALDSQPVTIAERLVDSILLWHEPQGLRRALRMRILAGQVTARYGRVQVLEWYLNSASYGHLAFGVDAAARLYLGKPSTQLNLPEAALLIAANQAPALNPLDAPSTAIERQRAALDLLLARGMISQSEHTRAVNEKLALAGPAGQDASPAPAFIRLVLDLLAERFGRDRLERGGLRIITTLDFGLQIELNCLARTQLERLTGNSLAEEKHPDGSECPSVRLLPTLPPDTASLSEGLTTSAVVMDPKTGQILALQGDTTTSGETNWLAQRAPGSLLTPFVAVAGFARGMSPASLTWDIPSSLPETLSTLPNPDGKFHGPVRWRMAIANDYLAAQAQLLSQMNASGIWRLASAFGLPELSDESTAELIYRGGQVSPLEIAQAYSVFATQGERYGQRIVQGGDLRPGMILYVEDLDGVTWLDARQPEALTVVSPQLAYLIHNVLSDAAARQPSLGYPNPLEIGRPSGAKIGQIAGGKQVWVAGYTPQRVAVFWVGLPDSAAPGVNPRDAVDAQVNVRQVAGAWHALMQYVSRDQPVVEWPEPPGISHADVCNPSGQLPTGACPDVVSEVFLNGSEPTGADTLYKVFQINRETGRLATVFTPAALVEEKTYLVAPLQARAWAQAAGLLLPPTEYDAIQPPEPSSTVRIADPLMYAYVHGSVAIQGTAAGENFQSYQLQVGQGLNPQNWVQVGGGAGAEVKGGELGIWDTQGQEGLYAIRLQVIRQNQTVETSTIQVTVDNSAPLVRIPYPINGQSFTLPQDQTVTFQVEANDAIGLQRVAWWVDGRQVGESLQAPYVYPWQAKRGEHTLEVRAYDMAGNEGKSETVKFSVK